MPEVKESVKILLGIEDNLQDDVLDTLIDIVTKHLQIKLKKEVPKELEFIIVEIVVRRFNRIGSESMQSESVEGHSITFYDLDKEFSPYEEIIAENREDDGGGSSRGEVMFI